MSKDAIISRKAAKEQRRKVLFFKAPLPNIKFLGAFAP
jgi:hypothetical protein